MIHPQPLYRSVLVKLLLIFASTWMTQVMFAQDYVPTLRDGGRWMMGRNQGMGSWSLFTSELTCDSIVIDSFTYRVLDIGGSSYQCEAQIGYVREDVEEKRVYYRSAMEDSPYYDEEVLLFDFSVSVGDSVWIPGWGVPVRVDSIYMKMYENGQQYKYFEVSNSVFSYYEGLGSIWWGIIPECTQYVFMLNYSNSGENCDDVVSVEQLNPIDNIRCYPNPVTDELTINNYGGGTFNSMEYEIHNTVGQKYIEGVLSGNQATINLDHLPWGILILSIYENGRLIGQKRIMHN